MAVNLVFLLLSHFSFLLLVASVLVHGAMVPPKRICIIGGGASGLATARAFLRQNKYHVVLYEWSDGIGGVWNYRAAPSKKNKPMYQHLRTNLPKEIMQFRERPWHSPKDVSFVRHNEVQQYLQEYAQHFGLHSVIRTMCVVQNVQPLSDSVSNVALSEPLPQFRVTVWDANRQQSIVEPFDGVVVCNGHYNQPSIPDLPGLHYFQGQSLHSIQYDSPEPFANQRVLCVGGRASGSDVAREVATVAAHVYLSDTTTDTCVTVDNTTWCPKTVSINQQGNVVLDNGQVLSDIDVILWCTGYDYQFDFLSKLVETGQRRVQPLFQQLWHAHYPNLALVGLPHSVVPFPLFELQAQAVERAWSVPNVLPDEAERHRAAKLDAESGGVCGRRVPDDTHYLGDAQWDYCQTMAKLAGVWDERLENYIATSHKIYNHAGGQRKGLFPCGPDTYRELRYTRKDDQQSFEVQIPEELVKRQQQQQSL